MACLCFLVVTLLSSFLTLTQDPNGQDGCPSFCTKTVVFTTTKTVSKTVTSTASRCTKTITSTLPASTITVTAPTSPPSYTPTCAPTFKIQYQDIGYAGPTDYNAQYAIIAPDSEERLVLSRVSTASNATVFTLDPEGLIFANYTSPSTGSITVVGNTITADDPAGVLWTDQNEVFGLTNRGVLECQIGPCDTQLRCFAVNNKRFFVIGYQAEFDVLLISTPNSPMEEGLFVRDRGCSTQI